MIVERCDAYHDGHDCATPGACTTALAAMLDRSILREWDDACDSDDRRLRVR